MSRRDSSRVHIAVRQNDTLAEFENFKKKFLFANKQITKQNCSLSMKIEELNAHISTLYVENLRLRASEIALQSQLKREKVKSHKIMADAEAAVFNLLKHFGIIRESYNVPTERPRSPKDVDDSPPSPRTRKRPPRSPSALRFAKLPSVSDINEEPEWNESSPEENEFGHAQEFASERMNSLTSSRRRSSISRLPVPSRVSTPPPDSIMPSLEEGATMSTTSSRKRKLTRRTSGIISPSEPVPRPISPVLGSPMQQDIELSAEEEAAAMQAVEELAAKEEEEEKEQELRSKKPRKKTKTRDESESDVTERKDRKKIKDRDAIAAPRLKDVTNSPRRRRTHASKEAITDAGLDKEERKEDLRNSGRPALAISPPLKLAPEDDIAYLPTPLPSSAANTPIAQHFTLPTSDGEASAGGRERRTRKSVNYAEPKLNTKMRKPDAVPPPGARPSLASIPLNGVTTPTPPPSSSSSSSSSDQNQMKAAPAGSSPEFGEIEIEAVPLPSRSSAGKTGGNATGSSRRSTKSASSSSLAAAVPTKAKRKRLTHARTPSEEGMATDERDDDDLEEEEEEEEGTDGGEEADSEFNEFRTWANVNTRRKSVQGASRLLGMEDGFGRRHSMAV